MTRGTMTIRHVLTFDVEDWHQSTLDQDLPITPRVIDNTSRILDLLGRHAVRATFFVLGLVAEKYPDLVRRIHEADHEVASHGFSHQPVHAQGADRFRTDLERSIAELEGIIGERIVGYRAPDFSIPSEALWALPILAERGLKYDSSIFPFAGPRYGIREAFTKPFMVQCPSGAGICEFPLTTIEHFGVRMPAAGGGYFRLLPYAHSRIAVARFDRSGIPATAYFHPYEIDADEIRTSSHHIPLRLRLSQGLGRAGVARRLERLLTDFSWGPVRDHLVAVERLSEGRILRLANDCGPVWIDGSGAAGAP